MYTSRSFFTLNLITNLIACLCIIMLSSCNKDPYQDGTPELPPITMEGKNTLGFLLDGKVWVPYQESSGIFTPTLESILDQTTNSLGVEARYKNSTDDNDLLNISVTIDNERIYSIPNEATINFFYNKYPNCRKFKPNAIDAKIEIDRFDRSERIVSGTFNLGDMVNDCGDTITITDGRFDLKF